LSGKPLFQVGRSAGISAVGAKNFFPSYVCGLYTSSVFQYSLKFVLSDDAESCISCASSCVGIQVKCHSDSSSR
jgi:hypothetical protein